MTSTRQLAAIMFTDIVGYTALMGADEQKAMGLVRKNKDIQKPLVEQYNGSWLKEMGDGALSSFPTASDAINCALKIQEALNDDPDLNLRIGIHLGEIILEVGDVYGDGVNIASRLQSIAEPGGIYISDSVQKAIRGNKAIHYALLGELELKNVDYPVKTYALRGEFLPRPKGTEKKHLQGRLLAELNRRNVFRAGLAYLALAFIVYYLIQLITLSSTASNIIYVLLFLGFPISIYLAWNYERSPEGFVRVTSRKAWVNPYSDMQKKPFTGNFVIILLLVILVALVAFPEISSKKKRTSAENTNASSYNRKAIAVLPFDNLSNDPEQQYFSDGIQEDILNHLAKISELTVKSRSSTLRYRQDRPSIAQIGEDLQVGTILEGSVRKAGNKVRIAAQLIDVATDNHIWSETYDRELTEIFMIQSEVAIDIAKVLEVRLTGQQTDLISKTNTENITAYDYLLKARQLRHNASEESDYDNALALLQQAIVVDDQYAEAYAEMSAILYFDKSGYGVEQKIWLDSAFNLINKAIELDPNAGYAHLIRSSIYRTTLYQFEKANEDLDRAYELDPNDPVILRERGDILRNEGQYDLAAQHYLKSIDLGPGRKDFEYYYQWSYIYSYIGDFQNALDLSEQALALSPDNPEILNQISSIKGNMGLIDESMRYIERAYEVSGWAGYMLWAGEYQIYFANDQISARRYFERVQKIEKDLDDTLAILPFRPKLASIYQKLGMDSEAKILLEEALVKRKESIDNSRYDFWTRSQASAIVELGEVLAMQGNEDEAMDYLENPIAWEWWDPRGSSRFLERSRQFDQLRDNDRFKSLLARLQEEFRLSADALRKIVNEREASEQMKLGLEK